ncbi:MAG: undecaprenyl-diphosphate phosphatase [Acidobacteriota bacterium]|nr:undecaprenyl-diphosphate phosphatase [Acidobacteriota bacterium]
MSLFEIIILGIIQGLTEFLPVSSSGHLVIFQNLFRLQGPQVFTDAMLHAGTLCSLFIFLRKDILALIQSFFRFCFNPKKHLSDPNLKVIFSLILASIPTALMGYTFSNFFESLFNSMKAVGGALMVTGVFLFITKISKERPKNIILHPLLIGFLQGLAIVPGFSRSGFTIGGALLLGWNRRESARFSFLLSIPAILGACLFQLQKNDWASQPWGLLLTGIFVASVFGYFALVFLSNLVQKGKFYVFSFYCFFAGIMALTLSFVI